MPAMVLSCVFTLLAAVVAVTGANVQPKDTVLQGGAAVSVWATPEGVFAKVAGRHVVVDETRVEMQGGVGVCPMAGGGFVVVWASTADDAVAAQLFTNDGTTAGDVVMVTGSNPNEFMKLNPDVACSADGGFLVAWEEMWDQDPRLFYRAFMVSGQVVKESKKFHLADGTNPRAASTSAGTYAVLYTKEAGQGGLRILLSPISVAPAEQALVAEARVPVVVASKVRGLDEPSLAVAGSPHGIVAVWHKLNHRTIFSRTFSVGASPAGRATMFNAETGPIAARISLISGNRQPGTGLRYKVTYTAHAAGKKRRVAAAPVVPPPADVWPGRSSLGKNGLKGPGDFLGRWLRARV